MSRIYTIRANSLSREVERGVLEGVGPGDWAPTRDAPTAGPERVLRNDLISFMGRG